MQRTTTVWLTLIGGWTLAPAPLTGQDLVRLAPGISGGASVFEFDEGRASRGVALEVGSLQTPYFEVMVLGEYWPKLGSRVGWTTQLETSFYPTGRRAITPQFLLGLGYFRASPSGGLAASFGLGLRAQLSRLTAEVDGLIRQDAGVSGDAELRFLAGYAAPVGRQPVRGSAGFYLFGMVPVRGPWRFREPGYGARLATRVTERHSGVLALALLHWQIPYSGTPGAYSWDTRAVLIQPGWQRTWRRGMGEVRVGVGPAITMMFEGPDNGMRGGAHAGVSATVRTGVIPWTAGIEWLWFSRAGTPGSVDGSDQHGVLLSAGLGY